jgi:hypothetical protein
MKTALIILGVVLAPMIIYGIAIALGWLDMKLANFSGYIYKRNDTEAKDDTVITKTRYTHRQKVLRYSLFGAVAMIFSVLSLVVFIAEGTVPGIMILAFGAIMTILPFFLLLEMWLSYEVIEDGGIYMHRIFGKKFVRFSDMSYYKQNGNGYSDLYEIVVYGSDNKRLMWVHGAKVGMPSIINALENKQIKKED